MSGPGYSGLAASLTLLSAVAKAFINGAQNFLTYNVPNDGKVHLIIAAAHVHVGAGGQAGGGVSITLTTNGVTNTINIVGAAQGAGDAFGSTPFVTNQIWADPGTTVTVKQLAPETAGAGNTADVYLWAS
jgi:hypothetical protein